VFRLLIVIVSYGWGTEIMLLASHTRNSSNSSMDRPSSFRPADEAAFADLVEGRPSRGLGVTHAAIS
jgi:hypothetical protein